ncbi:MAG: glycosyltransferase [Actinobacteria bacterium]|nr:glycosyltransferase [Actinomycetota bacterium]
MAGSPPTPARLRLGVYADLRYRRLGDRISTDFAFVEFLAGLVPRVEELVVFGRLDPEPGMEPYALPEGARFVALPHYPKVTALRSVARSLHGARRAFRGELGRLDAVWLFGPHPLSFAFARLARLHGTPVFLGVRQDFPRYVESRLPGRSWQWAVPVAKGLELAFRRLARSAPAVVVGEELGRSYRQSGARVLVTGFSLVRVDHLAPLEEALARPWDGDLRLLWVGRIDPEKDPVLLPDVLAALEPRWHLTLVGVGRLAEAVARRARALGVRGRIDFAGYVPNGPELRARYGRSHALVNVSVTEGVPQVLFEAHAAGVPVVATDVGGVRAALRDGELGLVVPPRDAAAVAAALTRLAEDAALRERLVVAGLEHARRETLDVQLDRILAFFAHELER